MQDCLQACQESRSGEFGEDWYIWSSRRESIPCGFSVGLQADMEAVSLIATEVGGKPGGNNNPDGLGGKSGKTNDNIVNDNNIIIDKIDKPTRGDTTPYTVIITM